MRRDGCVLISRSLILCLLMVLAVLPRSVCSVVGDSSYDMLIIGPEVYADEMRRFIEFKVSQGITARFFSIEFINRSLQGSNIVWKIHEFAASEYKRSGIKYLLLVGTYEQVPAKYVYSPSSEFDVADFNYKPTDWYYGVPDWDDSKVGLLGGNIPKIAVGRLPVNNKEELKQVISKIIAVEKDFKCGPILIFDGLNGAFNSFLGLFRSDYHYCYISCDNSTSSMLNRILSIEDCSHIVSYTHGTPGALWVRASDGEWKTLMTCEDARNLSKMYGIHYLVACFAGALDLGNESLARALITSPAGPVVVIASSRVEVFDVQISLKFWERFSENGDVGMSFLEALQSYLCDQTVFSPKERRFQKYNLYLSKVIYGDVSWRISKGAENNQFICYAQPDSHFRISLKIEAPSQGKFNGKTIVSSSIFLFVLLILYYFLIMRDDEIASLAASVRCITEKEEYVLRRLLHAW